MKIVEVAVPLENIICSVTNTQVVEGRFCFNYIIVLVKHSNIIPCLIWQYDTFNSISREAHSIETNVAMYVMYVIKETSRECHGVAITADSAVWPRKHHALCHGNPPQSENVSMASCHHALGPWLAPLAKELACAINDILFTSNKHFSNTSYTDMSIQMSVANYILVGKNKRLYIGCFTFTYIHIGAILRFFLLFEIFLCIAVIFC